MNEFLSVENLRIVSWLALAASVVTGYYSAHHLKHANGDTEFVKLVFVIAIGLVTINAMATYVAMAIVKVAPGFAAICSFGIRIVPMVLSVYLANRIWRMMRG